jgi:energy-coupling factor transporter ATP-binding protein EcfA2
MKKPFVAVIGFGNSGKSTIIQSLTGCKHHSLRDWVTDKHTGDWIMVICSSPQEIPMSSKELKRVVSEAANKPKCIGLVMAIQPTETRRRVSLEDVFAEVDSTKAFENYAYIIATEYGGGRRDYETLAERVESASPATKVYEIDGRRFAFFNASFIRASSHLPS